MPRVRLQTIGIGGNAQVIGRTENNPLPSKEDNWIIHVFMDIRKYIELIEQQRKETDQLKGVNL